MDNVSAIEPNNIGSQPVMGLVIDNNDPTQQQRIRVRIPSVLEGPTASMPWIGPNAASPFGINGPFGTVRVPAVGSLVTVWFQNGDLNFGLYLGSPVPKSFADGMPGEFKNNYPFRYGGVDPKGTLYYTDYSTGEIFLRHWKGTTVKIDPEGSVEVEIVKNLKITVLGDTMITTRGTSSMITMGHATVVGAGGLVLRGASKTLVL